MITLRVIIAGALIFGACFLLHCLVWRFHRPAQQMKWLGIIFIVLPVTGILAAGIFLRVDAVILFFIFIEHMGFAASYIMTYPAVETISPTLRIVRAVWLSPDGLNTEAVAGLFSDEVTQAQHRLAREGFVARRKDAVRLSGAGKLVVAIFKAYRGILGLPEGEG